MKRLPLLIAIGYPAILFGILYVVSTADPFGIFDEVYLMGTGVFLPALAMTLLVILFRRETGPKLGTTLTLAVWIIAVTVAHFWIVSQFAASV